MKILEITLFWKFVFNKLHQRQNKGFNPEYWSESSSLRFFLHNLLTFEDTISELISFSEKSEAYRRFQPLSLRTHQIIQDRCTVKGGRYLAYD